MLNNWFKKEKPLVNLYGLSGGATGLAFGGGAGEIPGDPFYEYCTLHIPGDGTEIEVSRGGHDISATSTVSVTSNAKFSSAISLENTSNQSIKYIRVPNSNEIRYHTQNFCFEGWIYISSDDSNVNMNARIFQMGSNSLDGYAFLYSSSTIYFGRNDEVIVSDPRHNWNDGWHHFAITRTGGNTINLYRDGVLQSSGGNGTDNNSTADLFIGAYPGSLSSKRCNIKLEDFKFYKGTSKYTSNFTPLARRSAEYSELTGNVGTRNNPAINANAIYNTNNNAGSGSYYIQDGSGGSHRLYCEMTNFGGWMLVAKGDGSNYPIPTNQSLSAQFGGAQKGRLTDGQMNALTWNYCWMGMTNNNSDRPGFTSGGNGRNLMDRHRQLFTISGNKFNIGFNTGNGTYSSGSTDNGRNQTWSYKGPSGSSGNNLSGSPRQNGTVINGAGSTDYAIANTNTYGITPHDAAIGGAYVFSGNGQDGGGNFCTGFGSDHNNQDWETRYCYWFLK